MKKIALLLACILITACTEHAEYEGTPIHTVYGYSSCAYCNREVKTNDGMPLAESQDSDEFAQLAKSFDEKLYGEASES